MISSTYTLSKRLLTRVCSEFLEMPGLRLTSRQARRLWDLDEQTCGHILEFLVEAKFLCKRNHDGTYTRLTDGCTEIVLASNAKARIADVGAF